MFQTLEPSENYVHYPAHQESGSCLSARCLSVTICDQTPLPLLYFLLSIDLTGNDLVDKY